jgi:hypothetical protein
MFDRLRILREIAEKYPELLTVDQACEIAHATKKTIYDWSHRDLLDTCKIRLGRRVLFARDCFARWVLDHQVGRPRAAA